MARRTRCGQLIASSWTMSGHDGWLAFCLDQFRTIARHVEDGPWRAFEGFGLADTAGVHGGVAVVRKPRHLPAHFRTALIATWQPDDIGAGTGLFVPDAGAGSCEARHGSLLYEPAMRQGLPVRLPSRRMSVVSRSGRRDRLVVRVKGIASLGHGEADRSTLWRRFRQAPSPETWRSFPRGPARGPPSSARVPVPGA